MRKLISKRDLACLALSSVVAVSGAVSAVADEPQERNRVRVKMVQDGDNERLVEYEVEYDDSSGEKTESPKLWIGVMLKEVEGDLAKYLGTEEGILIADVMEDSPAADGGVLEGDVLVKVDDESVAEPSELLAIMKDVELGDKLGLTLLRRGKEIELSLKPTERPSSEDETEDASTDEERVLWLDVDGGDNVKMLKELKLRIGDEDVDVFQLGGPAYAWVGQSGKSGSSGKMNVQINKSVDGESFDIKISREDDSPAEIEVTVDGETKVYEEDDLEEMPEEIAEIVEKHLSKNLASKNRYEFVPRMMFRGQNNLKDSKELSAKVREMVAKSREMAEKHRAEAMEQAREYAKQSQVARDRVARDRARKIVESRSTANNEVEELRELVEQLREEVEQLRSKLKDND